jgi:hypothetical protein
MSSKPLLEGSPAEVRLEIYRHLGFPVDNQVPNHDLPSELTGRKVFLKQRHLAWEMDYVVAYSRYTIEDGAKRMEATPGDQARNILTSKISGMQCCTALMGASKFFADELHQILYKRSRLTISTDAFRELTENDQEQCVPG